MRYGINPDQMSESYGITFGNVNSADKYQDYTDRKRKSDVEDTGNHKNYDFC